MQGGRAPAQVRRHPAQVEHAAVVAPVGGEPGVDDVGAQLEHQRQAEQPVAGAAGARAGRQPGQHGQQEHVGQRVGEGDQPRPQPEGGIPAIGHIRNVHDSSPKPVVMIRASISPARSRPPVRLRIITSREAARSG